MNPKLEDIKNQLENASSYLFNFQQSLNLSLDKLENLQIEIRISTLQNQLENIQHQIRYLDQDLERNKEY